MLYDVLPPFFLFSSLSGVIIMLSRIMGRVNRQRFNQDMKSAAAGSSEHSQDKLLRPEEGRLNIFKHRLALIPHATKQTITQTRHIWQNRQQAKQLRQEAKEQEQVETLAAEADQASAITMPKSSWRDKAAAITQKSQQSIFGLAQKVSHTAQSIKQNRQSRAKATAANPTQGAKATAANPEPKISKAQNTVANQPPSPHRVILTKVTTPPTTPPISQPAKKAIKTGPTALQQAAAAIAEAHYDRAEDILLPYIVKHTQDAKAYMLLGQSALRQQSWTEAVEIFQQVLKINEREVGAYAQLGSAALHAGRFTLALQSLQRAHDEEPGNLEVLKQLMTIAQRMDNNVLKRSVREKITALHSR